MLSRRDKYIRRQEKTFERRFHAIQKKYKKKLITQIGKEIKLADNALARFARAMVEELSQEYRIMVYPVMKRAFKDRVKHHERGLGFNVAFNLSADEASKYIDTIITSQWYTSIPQAIHDDIEKILRDGIQEGLSYTEIAKQIEETDPVTFSKSRANLWAVNEVGRSYGWADFRADKTFSNNGYILQKRWITSKDSQVRATHLANEAQGWIGIDESFEGTGDLYWPSTVDYRCRCNYTSKIVGRT